MLRRKIIYLLMLPILVAAPLLSVQSGTGQAQAAQAAQVTITLGAAQVGVAETASVEARITCPSANCGGFTINFHFDRDKIRIENAAPGPFLGSQVLETTQNIDNAQGVVQLTYSATATPPAGADNLLFKLDVGGLIPGDAAITIDSVSVQDTTGAAINATATGASVTVVETGKIAFFSPPANNWEVAFTSERDGNPEVYVANADGSNQRRLTNNPALDGAPAWSPDGRIAFESARDGNLEIYVMNGDGSSQTRLTNNSASDTEPAWSPDGTKIAFVSDRDGNAEIYVMNADGSNQTRLTNDPGVDTYPAWSPDGKEIAFSSTRSGSAEVYLMNPDGTGVHQITSLFGANGWYPAWSPDNSMMSFTVERDNQADIYTMTRQATNITKLTTKPGELSLTDWSPDSKYLAFMNTPGGNKDVLVMDAQGQHVFRITDNPADDYDPAWHAVAPPKPVTAPPATPSAPCTVSTTKSNIDVRVGPGTNRSVFTSLPPNTPITVIGQDTDSQGIVWLEIDKSKIPGNAQVISLWVLKTDVQTSGDCTPVVQVTPPPIIPGVTPVPTGTWGECGSCQTCGHTASECETSPTGQCVWDPSHCGVGVPGGGPGCLTVAASVSPSNGGSVVFRYPENCTGGGYKPGSPVAMTVVLTQGWFFDFWSGDCPGLGKNQTVTFTINASCSAVAHVHIG